MSGESGTRTHGPRRAIRVRTWPAVAAVMVVVVLGVGAVGYVLLETLPGHGSQTVSRCSPPTNPVCQTGPPHPGNDVVLRVPIGIRQGTTTLSEQGQPVSAQAAVSGGEEILQWQINWGDGSSYMGASPSATRAYSGQGSYVLSAQALDNRSTWRTGFSSLVPLNVTPSSATSDSGFYPTLATSLSNGSTTEPQFGWLEGSGTVSVSARYTSLPTAAWYAALPPSLVSTGGNRSDYVQAANHVSASYAFSTPGIYDITMIGPITGPGGTSYQNYTWTVVVSPPGVPVGCGSCAQGLHGTSPHPGRITYQEVAPGGASTEDPSVAYDTVSAEPIWNVYQTLVTYDGGSTASFLPELSLCVPGPDCQAKFGNTLLVNDGSSPRYWTFPIDPGARFFDSATGANWSVYPSDVMFSLARSCGFADLPGVGAEPGWIQCQALLPNGSASWDGGIHAPYNNTPRNILGSMRVNDSTYCPTNVMAVSNGCITFDAWGGGAGWPFFLELMADPMGASVEPCGWFSAQSAGIPGFAEATSTSGDGPCFLPGHAESTSDSSYQNWLTTTATDTYWDTFEELALNVPVNQPNVRWNMVGSGPYYLANPPLQQSVGYTLLQSPAYHQPTGCVGVPDCEPAPRPHHYAANVTVVYQQSDTIGIEQYQTGQTDFATIQPAETSDLLSLIEQGKIGAFSIPTLNIFLLAFSLTFSVTAAKTIDPNPLNVPGDFFSYVGLREFLVHSFPYATVESTYFTSDSVAYGSNYGGIIPQDMGGYYPQNISWPTGDPVVNPAVVGGAAWWWTQTTTHGSPYYDPELANCTAASPCQFPIMGQWGNTALDHVIQGYLVNISAVSNGRLAPNWFDCTWNCGNVYPLQPGQSAEPVYSLGWAPDYPDPTDYVALFYSPNSTYTYGDALYQTLAPLTCSQGPTPASSSGLLYWAKQLGVPQVCQGNAYVAMVWGMNQAAGMLDGPARVLMYNLVEHIANSLALYIYYDQQNSVVTYASWIDPSTINTNPVIGGGGDNTWYLYDGNGVTS